MESPLSMVISVRLWASVLDITATDTAYRRDAPKWKALSQWSQVMATGECTRCYRDEHWAPERYI
jgi:hypothetical protein